MIELNIGSVPIMLWTSMFALAFWLTAMLLVKPTPVESMTHVIVAVLRNALIAVAATKLLTQPLRGRFDVVEHRCRRLKSPADVRRARDALVTHYREMPYV